MIAKTFFTPTRRSALLALLTAAAMAAQPALASDDDDCGARGETTKGPKVMVIGLTADQRLVSFKECDPQRTRNIGFVSGLLAADTPLVGIDFRVQDGMLYGVGSGGGVYTIDPMTAAATKVSQLTVALSGASFGVDFNPAADRLRIVSDDGQNLRHNVNAGGATIADGALNNAGVPALGVTGAGYTNNYLDPNTGTSLFDIDTVLNQVSLQSPPNNGSLAATGKLTVDADSPVGFDIHTRLRDGIALSNQVFASLVVGGNTGFYRVDVLTGRASLIGLFSDSVVDIAIPTDDD